jgi:hypothetical protein
VPCYFVSIEEMTNDYPIHKIHNFLLHIYMLKPNEDHMNAIHVQMMNHPNLTKLFPLLWIWKSKYINNKKSPPHTYTFQNTWNQWFIKRLFTLNYFGKTICIFKKNIRKIFILKNCLYLKTICNKNLRVLFKKIRLKTTWILKNYLY